MVQLDSFMEIKLGSFRFSGIVPGLIATAGCSKPRLTSARIR